MSNRNQKPPETMPEETFAPSRRKFLTGGLAAAGLVACAGKAGINGLNGPEGATGATGAEGATGIEGITGVTGATGATGANCTNPPNGLNTLPTTWDYTADVVVIGSGAAGMVAALAAQSKGASVIVVEANYDVGGHAITSGGFVDLGGGTADQIAEGINDSPDLIFADLCFPASYVPANTPGFFPGLKWGQYGGPYQDRAFCRTFADNNVAAYNFLIKNGCTFSTPLTNSHWNGTSGTKRTRTAEWKGTTSNPAGADSPCGNPGVGYIRPLEATARSKGIQFLLNYKMTTIYRDAVLSGTVRGVSASYTNGRIVPGSSTPLQPYCATAGSLVPNVGNITTTQPIVNIKANKGVFVSCGGASSNLELRKKFDMRMCDVYQVGGEPYSFQTGDGILNAMKCGAALYATGNETAGEVQVSGGFQITKPGYIGSQYGYGSIDWTPTSPVFGFARASGLGGINYQNLIQVNMAGQRFVDETATGYTWVDACMQPNSASVPPDWSAGPVWAIFDSAAVTRQNWNLANTDPEFFYSGSTIAELVAQINTHQYQITPMTAAALSATISRYNSFVGTTDTDFGKPSPQYAINAPPYYAAFSCPTIHDWLTGINIDSGAHVLDLDGAIIPGLYAAGEDVGGMLMHGLAKCAVFGMIGGYNAGEGV